MKEFIIKYWIQAGFGGVVAFVGYIAKKVLSKIKAEQAEQKLIREGLLALLHDRLYQACQHHIGANCITVGDLDNLEYLYESYHDLGGNGTGTELYQRCKALPIRTIGRC